jgi:hypothetical protein
MIDEWDSLSLCPHCFCATKTIIFLEVGNFNGPWEPVPPSDPRGICGKCKELKNGQPTN